MSSISTAQFQEMLARSERYSGRLPKPSEPVEKEATLHRQIMDWCNGQWPRWKFIHARTDQRSTIQIGSHDLTVFGPFPKCLLIECKTKTGKLSEDQLIWKAEMSQLGWTVEVVRSMGEFLTLIKI